MTDIASDAVAVDPWNSAAIPGPTPNTTYPAGSIPRGAIPVPALPSDAIPYTPGMVPQKGQRIIYQTAPQSSHSDAVAPDAVTTEPFQTANGAPSPTTPTLKPDFGLGVMKGIYRPIDNITKWADSTPLGDWMDNKVGPSMGFPSGNQQIAGNQAAIDQAAVQGRTPDKWGDMLGGIISTAPLFAVTHNPALLGGMSGALTSDNPTDPGKLALDTATGAAGGWVGGAAVKGAQGLLSPALGQAQKILVNAGVRLTPGQMMGGFAHQAEDSLTHLGIPNGAQSVALKDFNRATLSPALAQIGETLPDAVNTGHDALNYVNDRIGNVYNKTLSGLSVRPDQTFNNEINQIGASTAQIPGSFQEPYQSTIQQYFGKPAAGNDFTLSGDALKDADSKLGQVARQYAKSPDPAHRDYADALAQTRVSLHDLVGRANPQAAASLQSADRAYAIAMRADKAASTVGSATHEGVFTPNAYLGAIRSLDGSVRNRAFAHGDALMQPLATAAAQVLPSKVSDSGTTMRALITAGMLGIGGESMHLLNPETIAGVGMAMAPYTKTGMSLARSVMTAPRPSWAPAASGLLGYAKYPAIAAGARSPLGLLPLAGASLLMPEHEPLDSGNGGQNGADPDSPY